MAMPLDPQAAAFLDLQVALGFRGFDKLPVAEARAQFLARDKNTPRQSVGRVENRVIPDGPPVRIYWPLAELPVPKSGKRPGFLFFHGGGWVLGGPDSCDVGCRALSNGIGAVVVSVDYRLAPEHKFPSQVEDAFTTWRWMLGAADELGVDPDRIAIGGDSAGGNLALVTCLRCRDEEIAMPAFQALVYPVVDFAFDTPSYRQFGEGYGLSTTTMRYYWDAYLASPEDGANPYASPLRADLRGLPPAWIASAEFDPLRSEVESLAKSLAVAGVHARLKMYEGQIHGFYHLGRVMERGKEAIADSAQAIRLALYAGSS
jgi:acetyl esterase/lipase